LTVFLALLAALAWGTGDFFGGVASRHGRATAVTVGSQVTGVVAVLVLAPIVGGVPSGADVGWGAVAGVSGGLGLLFLYRGMAVADMGLVVPVAAIGTGVFPLLFDVATGERPGAFQAAGLLLALVAIWLVSYRSDPRHLGVTAGLLFGLGAGAGFGGLLVGLSRIGDEAGIWPLAATRLVGGVVVVAIGVVTREALRPHRHSWRAIVPAATLGVLGNAFFLFASQEGPLAVAAVVGALFPAVTVLLARFVLQETLTPTRISGLAAAVVAVGLISAG
jgi:drug/metabolite transporter (DMT)-like permease